MITSRYGIGGIAAVSGLGMAFVGDEELAVSEHLTLVGAVVALVYLVIRLLERYVFQNGRLNPTVKILREMSEALKEIAKCAERTEGQVDQLYRWREVEREVRRRKDEE